MRILILLIGVVIVLAWLAFELKEREPGLAQVLAVFAMLVGVLIVGAFFGLY